jgi:hypothetical protein
MLAQPLQDGGDRFGLAHSECLCMRIVDDDETRSGRPAVLAVGLGGFLPRAGPVAVHRTLAGPRRHRCRTRSRRQCGGGTRPGFWWSSGPGRHRRAARAGRVPGFARARGLGLGCGHVVVWRALRCHGRCSGAPSGPRSAATRHTVSRCRRGCGLARAAGRSEPAWRRRRGVGGGGQRA